MNEQNILELLRKLPPEDAVIFLWHLQRRKEQTAPDPLPFMWFLRAGRGAGKTHAAANHIFEWTKNMPILKPKDRIIRVALVGETASDVKHTMVEGDSGLLNVIPEAQVLAWNRTMGELRYELLYPTRREVLCQAYSSEKPDQIRGPQHHVAWIDEVAKLRDSDRDPMEQGTTYSNLFMSLRLGAEPHMIITGTPESSKLVKFLDKHPDCVTTNMKSFDNRGNIAQRQLDQLERLKPGTRFYRQEILGEILYDVPDALFFEKIIEDNRRESPQEMELILGYDPSISGDEDADESGIIMVGFRKENDQNHAYVLKDDSGHYSPREATKKIVNLIMNYRIKTLCLELNQGLSFVMTTLEQAIAEKTTYKLRKMEDKKVKYGKVQRWKVVTPDHIFFIHGIQCTQGKQLRAEPASIAYEMDLVHHTKVFEELEEQMVDWSPQSTKDSPDRLDALVFCLLEIFGEKMKLNSSPTKVLVPDGRDLSSFGSAKNPYAYELGKSRALSVYNLDI